MTDRTSLRASASLVSIPFLCLTACASAPPLDPHEPSDAPRRTPAAATEAARPPAAASPAGSPSRVDGVRAIVDAPIARAARLAPCRVELEHKFLGPDDATWITKRTAAFELVRAWGERRAEASRGAGIDWESAPIAPIPLTRAQASSLLDGGRANTSVQGHAMAQIGEDGFDYAFDDSGRTIRVDWDPVADSGVYVFHYQYDCPSAPPRLPVFADDAAAPSAG